MQGTELIDTIVESESAKSLNGPGMAKLLATVDKGKVQAVIVARLDRLTRSVKDVRVAGAVRAAWCGADIGCRIARIRALRREGSC